MTSESFCFTDGGFSLDLPRVYHWFAEDLDVDEENDSS